MITELSGFVKRYGKKNYQFYNFFSYLLVKEIPLNIVKRGYLS